MNYWPSNKKYNDFLSPLIGGKARNLFKLQECGVLVPTFGVVTAEAHKEWKISGELPFELLQEIKKDVKNWGGEKKFAVRSSMASEDGNEHSFAGIMESFLFVSEDKLEEKIVECFKSLDDQRVLAYQKEKKIDSNKNIMSVIVQKMIDSDVSGVAFSRSPKGESSLMLIESSPGLCEGVVSGTVEVDQYQLDRFGDVISESIREKKKVIGFSQKKILEIDVEESDWNKASLNRNQLGEIFSSLLRIEKFFNRPVDIEWTFPKGDKDRIILLQARPITQPFKKLEYFVDTNLSESYPGRSSPFTGSVVPKLYKNVFTKTASFLGASEDILSQLQDAYKMLVQYHGGHLYYHLPSYYKALCAMPGGEKNIDDWHKMIGGEVKSLKIDYEKIRKTIFDDLKTYFKMIIFVFSSKRTISKFLRESRIKKEKIKSNIRKEDCPHKLAQLIVSLTDDDFEFHLTAVNDLLIIIFLSLFESRAKKQGLKSTEILNYLRSNNSIDSIKPLLELQKTIERLDQKDKFINQFDKLVSSNEYITFKELYEKLGEVFKKDCERIKNYLSKYGDRSFEELKFESLSFSDSPKAFIRLLKWFSGGQNLQNNNATKRDSLKENTFFFRLIGNKLREFVENRENMRLVRGEFYALIRNAVNKWNDIINDKLSRNQQGPYNLTISHFDQFAKREITADEIRALMNCDSRDHTNYPEFFCSDLENEPYFLTKKMTFESNSSENSLRGHGASPHKSKGEIMIMSTPEDAYNVEYLSDKILVTQTTDPAWVFIMSKCIGLISEKGSLLSHTAIIGRELKLATVVGVKNATQILKTGMKVEIDGTNGVITILS